MTDLSTTHEFNLILDFALGLAGRGIPLALVSVSSSQPCEGEARETLTDLVSNATRYTDRIAPDGEGGWIALLIDCNRQGALLYADRVLDRCAAWQEANAPVVCGIAVYRDDLDSRDAILRAAVAARGEAGTGGAPIGIHGE